ncbi:MAG: hypothetical protein ACOYKD_03515 [Anaerolineaceae bacterium]|jgi:hypothetical protein
MKILICLVGGQPAPNVLPIIKINPDQLILVYSKTTEKAAKNTENLVRSDYQISNIRLLKVDDAYDLPGITLDLNKHLEEDSSPRDELIFNLTGGTKIMALAAFELAKQKNAKAFYYQSEENKSLIHNYHFEGNQLKQDGTESILSDLTLDQYLRLYLSSYNQRKITVSNAFENNVIDALIKGLSPDFEVIRNVCPRGTSNVEIDFAIRCQNIIGVAEIKEPANKSAFEQLNSVTTPDMLGTYTKKFIIHANPLHVHNQNLMDAYKIVHIHLPSGKGGSPLSVDDKDKLVKVITSTMKPKKVTP